MEIREEKDEEDTKSKNKYEGEYEFFALETSFPDRTVKKGKDLSISLRMKIAEVLVEFKDIFFWNSDDFGGIPKEITLHKLSVPDKAKLVLQKKRVFTKARQEVTKKQVQELLATGIIKEIDFPEWLANPILVSEPEEG